MPCIRFTSCGYIYLCTKPSFILLLRQCGRDQSTSTHRFYAGGGARAPQGAPRLSFTCPAVSLPLPSPLPAFRQQSSGLPQSPKPSLLEGSQLFRVAMGFALISLPWHHQPEISDRHIQSSGCWYFFTLHYCMHMGGAVLAVKGLPPKQQGMGMKNHECPAPHPWRWVHAEIKPVHGSPGWSPRP